MNYNIPPPGRLRLSSRYRWVAGQSTLFPLHIASIINHVSNSTGISSDINPENLYSDESVKRQNKFNVKMKNERIPNLSLANNPTNTSLLSDVPSNLLPTTSSLTGTNSSECSSPVGSSSNN
uniref:Uncharacterized protein n=1 Tax=Loa loa TaxID=7209 RepID=A0A1I7VUS8_LOALO